MRILKMNTIQLMKGTLLILTCASIVFEYKTRLLGALNYGRSYSKIQVKSSVGKFGLVTNASREIISPVAIDVVGREVHSTAIAGRETKSNSEGDILAAILSCNTHWLSAAKRNGLSRFPRTFHCSHLTGKLRRITFISTINNATGISDADVVIFAAGVSGTVWEEAMRLRTSRQVWVYSTAESQINSPQVREGRRPIGFAGYQFNMSFLYHSKSEIVAPFGEYFPSNNNNNNRRRAERQIEVVKIAPKRTINMIVWVSSHCATRLWNRTGLVHNLAKFLPVHMYGECGTMPHLPRGKPASLVLQTYKFYIAFENSCCSDYISEKFWKALAEFDSVPIVVGATRADYERVAPPNSFIFAGDFDSVGDLARHIRRVANNETLYNEYHRWRMGGKAVLYGSGRVYPFTSTEGACSLLRFLEQNAWKANQDLRMRIDPYGPDWLDGCGNCSQKYSVE